MVKKIKENSSSVKYLNLFLNLKLIFLLLIIQSSISSQVSIGKYKWKTELMGNAFDGFNKMSGVYGDDGESLITVNNFDNKALIKSTDEISVRIAFRKDLRDEVLDVLMSFDDNTQVYKMAKCPKVNYFSDNIPDFCFINLKEFYYNKDNNQLNDFDIIRKLKSSKRVNFRIRTTGSNDIDLQFSLKGSTEAIDKNIHVSNKYVESDKTSARFLKTLAFDFLMRSVKNSVDGHTYDLHYATMNCLNYLEKNYGAYHFEKVSSIRENSNKELIIFENCIGQEISRVKMADAFKNLLFFSGKFKRTQDKTYIRDDETIEMYFDILLDEDILNSPSLEDFMTADKFELKRIFDKIILDDELFEVFRIQPDYYINYSKKQYNFETFIQPWGLSNLKL